MEHTLCDLCGADRPQPYLAVKDRFTGQSYNLVSCSKCGLIYLDPRPTEPELADNYPDDYEAYQQPVEALSQSDAWHKRRMRMMQLALVEQYTSQPGRLLDVGCATGEFLAVARDHGWEVTGVELVEKAASLARERYGLHVLTGDLESAPLPAGYFTVVTFWDVLEHVQSPMKALQRCSALLVDGGVVVISIPNLACWERFLFGREWIGWDPPRHLTLFEPGTIHRLFMESGFELLGSHCILGGKGAFFLSLDRVLAPYKWKWIVQRLYPVMGALLWPYRQVAYWFKRGPIITYIARKA